jgi:hypothetical protein
MHLPIAVLRTLIVVAVISVHFFAARVRRGREEARARRTGRFSVPETAASLTSGKPLTPK